MSGKDVEETDGTMLHGLLKTILSEKQRSLMGMCNLSDLIEEGGIAKGIEQGRRMEMIDSRVEILSRWIKLASRVESVKEFAEAM